MADRSRALKAVAACAALAALALASPAGAAPVDYSVTTRDGATLRGWVHLPATGHAPYATVLEFTPYIDNNGSDSSEDLGGFDYLLNAGFALARVSVRGTGRSDGCLHFGDHVDVSDVTTVIDDLARQKWSTGSIGMVGHSYPAWTQDMAVTTAPAPLKAVVPTSGVSNFWSLLTRRGAPLAAGLGVLFAEAWTAQTSVANQGAPEHLRCPNLPVDYAANAETFTTGDRTAWFEQRILADREAGTRVPMLRSNGLQPVGEGHIMQIEGLWDRLRPDRTHFILGQWYHETPEAHRPEWPKTVVAWFDHYLRGGPKTVPTGVVEYQDDALKWHTADRWPPVSRTAVLKLSGTKVVPGDAHAGPADQTLVSGDADPGLAVEAEDPRIAVSACGPHQALYVSPPAAQDALLAGNFEVDAKLTSTLPGGNFAVFIWKTTGDGSCPDPTATVAARAMMDLRHWRVEGLSHDFPVGAPASFTLRSEPFASQLRKGERLVVAVGGGAVEITPDPLKPVLTVNAATFRIPVVAGDLRFAK
jgi:predicted acyl esterase